MAKAKRGHAPAKNPENRLQQVGSLALDAIEERIRAGKATGAELIFAAQFLDPSRELKKEKLAKENQLLQSKSDAIASEQKTDEMYEKAIEAMRHYSGNDHLA